jgi:hypothetical protein
MRVSLQLLLLLLLLVRMRPPVAPSLPGGVLDLAGMDPGVFISVRIVQARLVDPEPEDAWRIRLRRLGRDHVLRASVARKYGTGPQRTPSRIANEIRTA